MDVVVIRSFIGEEMVAELVSDTPTDNAIILSRPRVFQFQQGKGGQMEPSLVPWLILDPENRSVPINANYIATMIPASAALSKSYQSAVSGIALS